MAFLTEEKEFIADLVKKGVSRQDAIKTLNLTKAQATSALKAAPTLFARAATAVRSIGPAASSAAATLRTGVSSAGTAAAGVASVGASAVATTATGILSGGAAFIAVAAVGVGLAGWTGVRGVQALHARATNGSVASNEAKYQAGTADLAEAQAKHMAQSGSKRKRSRSEQLSAYHPEDTTIAPEPIVGAGAPVGQTDALTAAERLAANPADASAIMHGDTSGGASAGPVLAGSGGPKNIDSLLTPPPAATTDLKGNVPSPTNDTTAGQAAAPAKKKEGKKEITNFKNKMMAGSLLGMVGAFLGGTLLPTIGGLGLLATPIGGALLGAGLAFGLGWYLWKWQNE